MTKKHTDWHDQVAAGPRHALSLNTSTLIDLSENM
jgi:hypothetical protein